VPTTGIARACQSKQVIAVKPRRGARIRKLVAYVGRRGIGRANGARVRVKLTGLPDRSIRVRLYAHEVRKGNSYLRRLKKSVYACRS